MKSAINKIFRSKIWLPITIVLLLALNWFGSKFHTRIDFTNERLYSVIRSVVIMLPVRSYDGRLIIQQYSDHLAKVKDSNYKPLELNITEETFILLLESMTYAAKKLGINKQENIAKLTEGKISKEIEFVIFESQQQ